MTLPIRVRRGVAGGGVAGSGGSSGLVTADSLGRLLRLLGGH